MTDLAPQVAGANRGRPGKIKINEFCSPLFKGKRNVLQKRQRKNYLLHLFNGYIANAKNLEPTKQDRKIRMNSYEE